MSDAFARARPDTTPTEAPTRPTASMLAYAFGERVAPPAGRLGGKLVPCSGRMVDSQELAITMVHIALWDLARREVVRLETRLAPRGGPPAVVVRPDVRATPDDEMRGSLENVLFRSARSGREDRELGDVVEHLYPRDADDPFAYIFEIENEAMLEAHLMRRDAEGRVGMVPGATPAPNQLVWLCENVARHIVGFTTLHAEWNRDRLQDEATWARVHSAIRVAIESRRARGE